MKKSDAGLLRKIVFPKPKTNKYDSLLRELEQLKTENARLKDLLQANGIAYEFVTVDVEVEKIYSDSSFPDAHLGKDERVVS